MFIFLNTLKTKDNIRPFTSKICIHLTLKHHINFEEFWISFPLTPIIPNRVVLRRKQFKTPHCTHRPMRQLGACPQMNCAPEHSEHSSHCSVVVSCRQFR
jgi:hypothetical protein